MSCKLICDGPSAFDCEDCRVGWQLSDSGGCLGWSFCCHVISRLFSLFKQDLLSRVTFWLGTRLHLSSVRLSSVMQHCG